MIALKRLCSPEQAAAVKKHTAALGGIVWWKVGEGKTRIAIFTFASLQIECEWSYPCVCLVVCRRSAFLDWRSEIELCLPGSQVYEDSCPVHPPGSAPVFLLVSHADVKGLASLQFRQTIKFVIIDELWMYANHKSARSKAMHRMTMSRRAMGLSGTIMKARDLFEIYCQCMVVQQHRRLSPNPTSFRSKYQTHVLDQFGQGGPQVHRFTSKPNANVQIMSALDPVVSVHFPKSPRKHHEQIHRIRATPEQSRLFKELRDFYSIDSANMEFNNALAVVLKTQQIANGWFEDSEGTIRTVASGKTEKLRDELADIIASGERAIVWCAFRHDVEMLAAALSFATVQMLGGQEFDLDRWRNGDVHVCLATEASGSSVNHFAQTKYAIYFSTNHKWLDMQQSRGRTDRKNSSHSECYYKFLCVDGSMDHQIYRAAMESGASEARLIIQAGLTDWLKQTRTT